MHFLGISVSFILAALSACGSATSLSDFSHSCQDFSLVEPVLFANCNKEDGSSVPANISLDQCVKNNNGVLDCGKK